MTKAHILAPAGALVRDEDDFQSQLRCEHEKRQTHACNTARYPSPRWLARGYALERSLRQICRKEMRTERYAPRLVAITRCNSRGEAREHPASRRNRGR